VIAIDWNPDRRALRRWGLTMAIVMGVVGALFRFVDWGVFRAGHGLAPLLWGVGAAALLTAGTGSRLGRPLYVAWMGFAWLVGTVIGTLALAIVFYGVVTPLALVGRLAGRDRLDVRRDARATRWHPLPQAPHDPARQF
jgi:polyferredoxin